MNTALNVFIKNPEKEFHLRELARMLKKSPATISKQLKELLKQKIITTKKLSNHNYFRANTENKNYKQLKLQHNLQEINNSRLIEFIEEEFNFPQAIILFGSYAKAENGSRSDIDLLIITPSKKNINLQKFEKKLGKEIQLFIHSRKEIEKMKTANPELLNNWINGIVLYGLWEVFE
ncbi:MAG: nucleotidyltransferase domain-containing protein [Parcubacteria group bacterium]|nr:nucleotidyltransferase domain-containing protein [Parcubacteria group bacterium]